MDKIVNYNIVTLLNKRVSKSWSCFGVTEGWDRLQRNFFERSLNFSFCKSNFEIESDSLEKTFLILLYMMEISITEMSEWPSG